jgi:quinol-cytochrome oxidoreductase complex cytochrome b subunit
LGLLHKVRQTASDQRLGIMHVMLTPFGIDLLYSVHLFLIAQK